MVVMQATVINDDSNGGGWWRYNLMVVVGKTDGVLGSDSVGDGETGKGGSGGGNVNDGCKVCGGVGGEG